MHTLTVSSKIKSPIPIPGGRFMKPGGTYIGSNALVGAMLTNRGPVEVGLRQWCMNDYLFVHSYNEEKFDPTQDWNNRSIWMMRGGGWGDLLCLTPLIQELKKRWPECRVKVSAGQQYVGVFSDLDVESVLLPLDSAEIKEGDAVISYENAMEGHPDAEVVHMVDHFASKMGIELPFTAKPYYKVTDEETQFSSDKYPRKAGVKRIGVQFMASCLVRSYPHIYHVVDSLVKHGVEVMLFGKPGQVELGGIDPETKEPIIVPENLINLTADKLTFRESAAVLATCDCVIAPDSALTHLASALGVALIALFGPFPAKLRVTGKKVKIMQGEAECSPCFFHATRADEFPTGMPCEKQGFCLAMASIPFENVVTNALKIASPLENIIDFKTASGLIIP